MCKSSCTNFDDMETLEGSSREESSLRSLSRYYCFIPGCPVALRPCFDIMAHVLAEHPDILIHGSIGDISFKLRLGRSDVNVTKLVVAHEKMFWVTLNYNARNKQLICGSVMLDKNEMYYPTHSVAIFLSGFGHEILLNQNFESKKMKGIRPLKDPVTDQELARMVNASNIIYALVHVRRRPRRKKREKSYQTSERSIVLKEAKISQVPYYKLLPEIIPSPFHCMVSSCGINIDFADIVRHFKGMHPDLFIGGTVGDTSLILQHNERDELLFKLMEAYGEIFLVMVAYWHHDVQLQLGSFMKCIPRNKAYVTYFKMSKSTAIVGQTLLTKLMNKHYSKPLEEKTFAVLRSDKVKDTVNSEGQLKITVKIKINSFQDAP